jgi:hypothetical protein
MVPVALVALVTLVTLATLATLAHGAGNYTGVGYMSTDA